MSERTKAGQHSRESQRLLNELSAAKINLLDPDKKQAYDQLLRAIASGILDMGRKYGQRFFRLSMLSHDLWLLVPIRVDLCACCGDGIAVCTRPPI